jgi:hypothetical protein
MANELLGEISGHENDADRIEGIPAWASGGLIEWLTRHTPVAAGFPNLLK